MKSEILKANKDAKKEADLLDMELCSSNENDKI